MKVKLLQRTLFQHEGKKWNQTGQKGGAKYTKRSSPYHTFQQSHNLVFTVLATLWNTNIVCCKL